MVGDGRGEKYSVELSAQFNEKTNTDDTDSLDVPLGGL